jgi:lysophospholipase L1-like esterase
MRFRLLFGIAVVFAAGAASTDHWVATWGTSPTPQLPDETQMRTAHLTFSNQTVREIVHVSIGGSSVRVRLSNANNRQLVKIGAAHLGLRTKDSAEADQSDRQLTFGGRTNVLLPADGVVVSDPVSLALPPGSDLAISLYIPGEAMAGGIHYGALQTSYIGSGDMTAKPEIADPQALNSWVFLAGVDVMAPAATAAVVTFGDSITDGTRSTPNTNSRWPNVLDTRLRARAKAAGLGVINEAIAGNRVLHDATPTQVRFGVNALARFDRDVLAQPGVKYVTVMEGINDIGFPPTIAPASEEVTAEDIIATHKQLIARAHEHGLKIYGATLTPFEGAAYYLPEKEPKRKAVNEWIRNSKAYDGVIDFDAVVRDPQNPLRILPAYDGGDHLHFSDAGYKAMGDAIDLSLFK